MPRSMLDTPHRLPHQIALELHSHNWEESTPGTAWKGSDKTFGEIAAFMDMCSWTAWPRTSRERGRLGPRNCVSWGKKKGGRGDSAARRQTAMATAKKLDASKLKPGDCMSRIQYITVVRNDGITVVVRDETGFEWGIDRSILEAQAFSSSQFTETKKVTRTELARICEQDVRDSVFSVSFTKMPNQADQEKMLADADLSTPAKRKRVAKDISTGPERILHGRIVDTHELVRPSVRLSVCVRARMQRTRARSRFRVM